MASLLKRLTQQPRPCSPAATISATAILKIAASPPSHSALSPAIYCTWFGLRFITQGSSTWFTVHNSPCSGSTARLRGFNIRRGLPNVRAGLYRLGPLLELRLFCNPSAFPVEAGRCGVTSVPVDKQSNLM